MRNYTIALFLTALFGLASSANAAITGYSNLEVTGLSVYVLDGGVYRPLSVSDFSVIQASVSAQAGANLTGYAGVSTSSALNPDGPFDAFQALIQPFGAPIGEDTFTQQSGLGLEPFSRGDTAGTGAIIDGLGTFGANVNAVSEVSLSPLVNSLGESSSVVGTNSTFTFSVANSQDTGYFLSARMLADLTLIAELDVPPGFNASAGANFEITIVDTLTGLEVLNWNPNGQSNPLGVSADGGVVVSAEVDPFSLNTSRTRFAANGSGTTQFSGSGNFSLDFFLPNGDYQLTIRHATNADALVVNAIPEPASMLVWGGLASALGLGGMIRRRKK
jgi:hypothetical protein